jgi:antitoxin component YwqK of YwqJK toxin-antitoxin module
MIFDAASILLKSLIIWFMLSAALAGCSQEIPTSQTVLESGRLYREKDMKPFTGYVVGKTRGGYRDGVCSYKKRYKEGIQNGVTKYWYPDGTLESVEPYKDGRIDGIVVRYYPNGRLKARMHLVNGERGGEKGEAYYSPDGKLIR